MFRLFQELFYQLFRPKKSLKGLFSNVCPKAKILVFSKFHTLRKFQFSIRKFNELSFLWEFRKKKCLICLTLPLSPLPSGLFPCVDVDILFKMCRRIIQIFDILLSLLISHCAGWEQFETPLEMARPNSVFL